MCEAVKVSANCEYDYVVIGDVHGRHDKLVELLAEIDFRPDDPESYASAAKLVFVGDLIDNEIGSSVDHLATLRLIKYLVDNGHAYCLLGNHELNAIGWATIGANGQPLRPHSEKNYKQHRCFLEQVGHEHLEWVEWFKSFPLYAEFGGVKVIHACWDSDKIERLNNYVDENKRLRPEFVSAAFDSEHELFALTEWLLKGPEFELPEGYCFYDKIGSKRTAIRVGWWLHNAKTYRDIGQVDDFSAERLPVTELASEHRFERLIGPVVVGHYSKSGVPELASESVMCVDYNAAKGDFPLVCYRWRQGDTALSQDGIVYVGKPDHALLAMQGAYDILTEQLDIQEVPAKASDEKLLNFIDGILWQHWDPLNVNRIDECRDEYAFMTADVAKAAILWSRERLAALLYLTECAYLGCSTEGDRRQRICGLVADKIVLMAQHI